MQVNVKQGPQGETRKGPLQASSSGVKENTIFFNSVQTCISYSYENQVISERIMFENQTSPEEQKARCSAPFVILPSYFLTLVSKTVWRNRLTLTGSSTTASQSWWHPQDSP